MQGPVTCQYACRENMIYISMNLQKRCMLCCKEVLKSLIIASIPKACTWMMVSCHSIPYVHYYYYDYCY